MESLPSVLAQLILEKLAAQDLLSFWRANCACKWFQQIIEERPSIWRDAFLCSITGEQQQSLLTESEESALDAEVTLLGGYKRLAIARASCVGRQLSKGRSFHLGLEKASKDDTSAERPDQYSCASSVDGFHDVERHLIIFKLQAGKPGKLL